MTSATIIDFHSERARRGVSAPRFRVGDPVWFRTRMGEASHMVAATVSGIDALTGRLHIVPHTGLVGGRYVNDSELSPRNSHAACPEGVA